MKRRPAQQRAPVEGQAQHRLRPIGDALHERIDGDDRQRGNPEDDREPVKLREHQESRKAERNQECKCLCDAHLARRDRPQLGALNLAIEIAVGNVVQRAARSAHDNGANEEQQPIPRIGNTASQCGLAQRQPPPAGQQ